LVTLSPLPSTFSDHRAATIALDREPAGLPPPIHRCPDQYEIAVDHLITAHKAHAHRFANGIAKSDRAEPTNPHTVAIDCLAAQQDHIRRGGEYCHPLFHLPEACAATATKQRDQEAAEPFAFVLESQQLGLDQDGDPVTTCTVKTATEDEAQDAKQKDANWSQSNLTR